MIKLDAGPSQIHLRMRWDLPVTCPAEFSGGKSSGRSDGAVTIAAFDQELGAGMTLRDYA